jgi:uncharacterized protein (DUF433 family)
MLFLQTSFLLKSRNTLDWRPMTITIKPESPPLRIDESGAVRVGKTRVLFVLVVRAFQIGATPEEIIKMYETLDLAETYEVIAYYLRHKAEVEQYLAEYDRQGEEIRNKIEERQGAQIGLRERLLSRLGERHSTEAPHDKHDSPHTDTTPKDLN